VAFVDFSSREAAQAALARDGEIVFRNHKVLVSAYGQKGGKSYGKELERNKLFIRNLVFFPLLIF
jgi:hypothetical protein